MRGLVKRRHVIYAAAAAGVLGATGTAGAIMGRDPVASEEPSAATDERRHKRAVEELSPVDDEQRYVQLIPGGDGVIYGVQANGALTWQRHLGWQEGDTAWANGSSPLVIDTDWLRYRWVLAGHDGQLFGITGDGQVSRHRWLLDDPLTGAGRWADDSGKVIAERLGQFEHVFGGWDGVIVGLRAGRLWWHRFLDGPTGSAGRGGTSGWARGGDPVAIGDQFTATPVMSSDGTIYEATSANLYWRRLLGGAEEGNPRWAGDGKPVTVPGKWDDLRAIVPMGAGVFLTVDNARADVFKRAQELVWRRVAPAESGSATTAAVSWSARQQRQVASSFSIETVAGLQGYPLETSVLPGDQLGLAVSTGHADYTVTVVRVASGTAPAEVVAPPVTVPGRLQQLPEGYRSKGCGWTADHAVRIEQSWAPGVYAARLQAEGGRRFDLPFLVRPARPTAKVAFLLPTYSYNAYSDWGGHNQYTAGLHGRTRTLTTRRPSRFHDIDGPADLSLTGDLVLLRWMAAQKIAFDPYHDGDLHSDGSWLAGYRVLVLGGHPEYWSDRMRQHLVDFLGRGGRLIYPGGNGIYERVQVSADGGAITFRRGNGSRDIFRALGRPETELLGVGYHDPAYGSYAPYKVVRDHPLLAGTGLAPGVLFGQRGALGPASGVEVDRRGPAGSAREEHVIAVGQNEKGGAEMVFRPGPDGGWVFSAGSITFVGALSHDDPVQRLMRNVFDLSVSD